jgi:pimeloyl-ACP methyl ester carboxylesterase
MSAQHWVESGGIRLAARSWGDTNRPTIILVHGYPDCSHVWDAVAQQLSRHFHVIAYDVRGTGESDVPKAQSDYALAQLAADTVAVADALAPGKPFHLVGHDWGSIQSWETVTTPELQTRIASYTSLSGPCLDHVAQGARSPSGTGSRLGHFLTQLRQSWYIAVFHLPGAPLAWNLGMAKRWRYLLYKTEGLRVEHSPTQLKDGRNGINLYRANVLPCLLRPRERYTEVPVQLLVALRDPYVRTALFDGLTRWAPKLWRRDMDYMHWMPLSAPVEVAAHIAEFVHFIDSGVEPEALRAARVVEA